MRKILTMILSFIFVICINNNNIGAVDLSNKIDNDEIMINSPAVLLMEYSSGEILYQKNADKKMYPASITKVLTAIIVMEHCNLDDTVVVSQSALDSVEYGYITSNLKAGEEITVEQLLNILESPVAKELVSEFVDTVLEAALKPPFTITFIFHTSREIVYLLTAYYLFIIFSNSSIALKFSFTNIIFYLPYNRTHILENSYFLVNYTNYTTLIFNILNLFFLVN